MDKIFPKEKMVWPEEKEVSNKEKLRIWRKLFQERARKSKWIIIHMKRNWELPVREGPIGYLWNEGCSIVVESVPLKPGYYIVTKHGRLYRIIQNI